MQIALNNKEPRVECVHVNYVVQTALGLAIGIKGVVRKRRMLYMIGQTRVHVDQVEGLGDYMELEASAAYNQSQTLKRDDFLLILAL